ncbi:MAG: hypothetical protein ACOY46_00540 [Bacillota bacterium]
MQVIALVLGIISLLGMFVAFFPCLGSLNWLVIPFAVVSLIVSVIAYTSASPRSRGTSMAAIICCLAATFFGLFRLMLGGGIL